MVKLSSICLFCKGIIFSHRTAVVQYAYQCLDGLPLFFRLTFLFEIIKYGFRPDFSYLLVTVQVGMDSVFQKIFSSEMRIHIQKIDWATLCDDSWKACDESVLESNDEIIGKTDDNNLSFCWLLAPLVDPKVKYIVKIKIQVQRARLWVAPGRGFAPR